MKPRFLFPPHPAPHYKITPQMLSQHEAQNAWITQRKFNGAHCVIWVYQNNVSLFNRHGESFSNYQLTEGMKKCLLWGIDRDYDTEYVLDGELLHNKELKIKTTGKQAVENTIVLYDVLFVDKSLTSLNTLERLDILYNLAPPNQLEPKRRAFEVNSCFESSLWVAETFYNEFNEHFWEMYDYNKKGEDQYPEIEGLILKQKDAKNTSIGTHPNDVSWMIRCRSLKIKFTNFRGINGK